MKKRLVLTAMFSVILVWGMMVIGCGSAPETTKSKAVPSVGESVLLIQRDKSGSAGMNVFIDGMLQMKVKAADTGRVIIGNGSHSFYVVMDDKKIGKSPTVQFEVKSRQILFSVIVKKKKIELMKIGETALLESSESKAIEKVVSGFTQAFDAEGILDGSVIAVFDIESSGDNKDLAIGFRDELEHKLIETGKYKLAERASLDAVRSEEDFQAANITSEDGKVAAAGKLLGADVVITGSVTGTDVRRLRLKAIKADTAQVISTISEQF